MSRGRAGSHEGCRPAGATAIVRADARAVLAAVPAVLARLDRFEIDSIVRASAAAYQDPGVRPLDSIHLATAEVAASVAPLTAFVT